MQNTTPTKPTFQVGDIVYWKKNIRCSVVEITDHGFGIWIRKLHLFCGERLEKLVSCYDIEKEKD